MATRTPRLKRILPHPPEGPQPETVPCARDRLLTALESSPRLRPQDADLMDRAVKEARESSIADESVRRDPFPTPGRRTDDPHQ